MNIVGNLKTGCLVAKIKGLNCAAIKQIDATAVQGKPDINITTLTLTGFIDLLAYSNDVE